MSRFTRGLWGVGMKPAPISQCASCAIERSLTQVLQRQDCTVVRKSHSGTRQPDFRSCLHHLRSYALGNVLNLILAVSFLLLFLNSFIKIHFTTYIKFICINNSVVFGPFTELSSHHHDLILDHFITLKIPWYPFVVIFCSSPCPSTFRPRQPPTHFQSPWTCLLRTFHIKEIMQYMAFCHQLFSLSVIFSRFIHAVPCICTSFLFFF